MAGWFGTFWDQLASGGAGFWKDIARRLESPAAGDADGVRERATAEAPILWLLGKTGAGKTSIIAALTGDPRAEIGSGFKPCTRQSQIYDWPAEAPVLRFMDTRGLGEPGYDAAEDCAFAAGQSHILLVVLKVNDPKQTAILEQVRAIRRQQPHWPLLVALTGLHQLYPPGADHPADYPYRGTADDDGLVAVPAELRQAMRDLRALFDGVKGAAPFFVPLDITLPEDGYHPTEFGLSALYDALHRVGLDYLVQREQAWADADGDRIAAKAHGLILGYAAAAGVSGAVPIPAAGAGGLATVLGMMLRALAARYDVDWNSTRLMQFASAIGLGTGATFALGYGVRELVKLVPGAGTIVGGALNAAASSALVYGIGRAACVYLGSVRAGRAVPTEAIHAAFTQAFEKARRQKDTP